MKTMFKLIVILFVATTMVGCKTGEMSIADQKTITSITNKIDSANYTFIATTAMPMRGGRSIPLTSLYSLKITKDTITSYLPYFGQAYSAPYSAQDGGIKFESTKFIYKISDKKKGMWNVTIETQDTQGHAKLILQIGDTGYTSLTVQENNRQPISFYGKIE